MSQQQTSNNYIKQVKQEFVRLFSENKVSDENFHSALVKAIVNSFHFSVKGLNKWKKAQIILDQLFAEFSQLPDNLNPFQLSEFIELYIQKKTDLKPFLIALLNGLYFGDFNFSNHQTLNPRENLNFYMFQILAEVINRKNLKPSLSKLSKDGQITLMCYALRKYREGSFPILEELEAIFFADPQKIQEYELLIKLRKNCFDSEKLHSLLLDIPEVNSAILPTLLQKLEDHVEEQTKELYPALLSLIPRLIQTPMKIFKSVEEQHKHRGTWDLIKSQEDLKEAEKETEEMHSQFATFQSKQYSLDDLRRFVEIFGMVGHSPPFKFRGYQYPERSLTEKINTLHFLLNNPLAFVPAKYEVSSFYHLIYSIVAHLDAVATNPSKYTRGFKEITCTIPTYQKKLSQLPILPSILKAMHTIINYLNHTTQAKIKLKKFPLYVFDQSNEKIFAENKRYINQLNRLHKSSIIQLSRNDILSLAKKIGIESLINTTRRGFLGYGGARNSVFFLTPILKQAFKQGKKTVKEVLEIPKKELRSLFQSYVLGSSTKPAGETLLMLDDDMEIADSNLLSHALLAEEFDKEYFHSYGWNQGRQTKTICFIGLKQLLKNPREVLNSTKWISTLRSSGMSEYLSKPQFCLNLPYGSEEGHSDKMGKWGSRMLQPSYHLGGARFPTKQLPTHFFVGLEDSLKSFIPYALNISLISCLLDPTGRLDRSVLPWSNEDFTDKFSSLKQVFEFIGKEKQKKEMQKLFWMNIHKTFIFAYKDSFNQLLDELIQGDVDAIINEFKKQERLTRGEGKSLKIIGEMYKGFQKDAAYLSDLINIVVEKIKNNLKALGIEDMDKWAEYCTDYSINFTQLIDQAKDTVEKKNNINFQDFPFTQALYLILHVIGAGDFNESIKSYAREV